MLVTWSRSVFDKKGFSTLIFDTRPLFLRPFFFLLLLFVPPHIFARKFLIFYLFLVYTCFGLSRILTYQFSHRAILNKLVNIIKKEKN